MALDWLKALRPLIEQFARFDRELAKQLRCSSSSVILNLGEGMHSRGGHRTNAYGVALREMGESYTALQAAQVLGVHQGTRAGIRGKVQENPGDAREVGAAKRVTSDNAPARVGATTGRSRKCDLALEWVAGGLNESAPEITRELMAPAKAIREIRVLQTTAPKSEQKPDHDPRLLEVQQKIAETLEAILAELRGAERPKSS